MAEPLVPPDLPDPVMAYFRPRRVIIYGSVARGDATPDSDIDLVVVVDDDAADVDGRPSPTMTDTQPGQSSLHRAAGIKA